MSSEWSANRAQAGPQPFRYQPVGGDAGDAAELGSSEFPWGAPGNGKAAAASAEREKQAFEKGLAEGHAQARVEFEKTLAELRTQITGALRDFTAQREAYFERVEPEIVQLALAVARKILHREAQMDPLLLAGVVHVALDKLDAATQVRLRANPAEIRFWREYFSQPHGVRPAPELVGDAALAHSECALETDLGNTTISLDTQVKEIEQGFADLLEQRIQVR
jgi:flagellar assembly protein FliH